MRAIGAQSSCAMSPRKRFWPVTKPESRSAMRLMAIGKVPEFVAAVFRQLMLKLAFRDLFGGARDTRDGAGQAANERQPAENEDSQRRSERDQPRFEIEEQRRSVKRGRGHEHRSWNGPVSILIRNGDARAHPVKTRRMKLKN